MSLNALAISNAHPPRALAESVHELPFGSHSQVQTSTGTIAAFLAYVGYDRGIGTAKYALRILNNAPYPARARLLVEVDGAQIPAYPLTFEVAPYSMRDDIIPVRIDETGPFDRAIIEVSSESTYFVVEAAAPPREKRAWARWIALAFVSLVLAGAGELSAPKVLALSAPAKALPGTTISVPYQTSGIGAVEYEFSTRDGLQIAAGVGSSVGVLTLPIPAHGSGSPYILRVHKRNVLADQQMTATIAAVAIREPAPAQRKGQSLPQPLIDDISVSPSPVLAGSSLTVSYATRTRSGDVSLVDQFGHTWARAEITADGLSVLHVPQNAAGRDMRVMLHARNGKLHAQSSVGVSILASTPVQQPAPSPTPAAAAPSLSLDTHIVSAGDNIVVRASGVHSDVQITMMTSGGTTVAQGDIADSGSSIAILAPSVSTATVYYIVGAFSNGVSQQTIVRRVLVTPR